MSEGRQIYFVARFGMGDAISHYFSAMNYGAPNPTALILPRIQLAMQRGLICRAAVIVQSYTSATVEVFRRLSIPLTVVQATWELQGSWLNIRRTPWDEFANLAASTPMPLPIRRPCIALPADYVLFSDMASVPDRCNVNRIEYDLIKEHTDLPIIRVGNSVRPMTLSPWNDPRTLDRQDIDLFNQTHILETAWLAAHARLIVAPLTFFRCFSSLFGIPVIEVCEEDRVSPATIERTKKEYHGREYGMSELNQWFSLPSQQRQFAETLSHFRRPVSLTDGVDHLRIR